MGILHFFGITNRSQEAYEEQIKEDERELRKKLKELKDPIKINLMKEKDKRYICKKCKYKWESKKKFGKPSICPNCKSKNIQKFSNTKEYKKELEELPEKWKTFYKSMKKTWKEFYKIE